MAPRVDDREVPQVDLARFSAIALLSLIVSCSHAAEFGGFLLDADSLQQWKLPKRLKEISGLALTPDDRLFAIDDEQSVIYEIDYVQGKTISQDDPRINEERIEYQSPKGAGKMSGLLVSPAKESGNLPGIVVVHENRGLNPYIEDVARRGALEGFITLAPDALTPLGGYPGNDDEGRTMQRTRDREKMLQDFINLGACQFRSFCRITSL